MKGKIYSIIISVLTAGIIISTLTGSAWAAKYEWKYAASSIPGSLIDIYAKKLQQLLKDKSDGQIDMKIYYLGELGNIKDMAEALQMGAVELANLTPGHVASFIKEAEIFNIPYVFPPSNTAFKEITAQTDASFYKILAQGYEKHDLKLLDIYTEGVMAWTSNKPLKTPEDFKGLKIRVMVSPLLVEGFRAYGANPTSMPYGEVYSGLQLKIVEAQNNPINCIDDMKFYEVQKYITMANRLQCAATTTANLQFYENLPADIQGIVKAAIGEAREFIFAELEKEDKQRLARIKEEKPEIVFSDLTKEEVRAFSQLNGSVKDLFIDMTGKNGTAMLEDLAVLSKPYL